MSSAWLISLLLFTPLVLGGVILLVPTRAKASCIIESLHLLSMAVVLVCALSAVGKVLTHGQLTTLHEWVLIDAVSAIFVALIGVVSFLVSLYAIPYLRQILAQGMITSGLYKLFYSLFSLFVFTMLLAVTSNNLIVMWVAIEASTLSSTFLVGLYRSRASLEAAWKYLILCSVGVAFGLYGTILTFSNATDTGLNPEDAVLWTAVLAHASALDPLLAKIAFVFILIGFGTKGGIFPLHAWMPDGYAEAPSPASALLAGVLLNCPLFVIIRYYTITSAAAGTGFLHLILILTGILSLVAGALLFYGQNDLKRKLAYSSVENVGIILLGLGFGGPLGIGAALLHIFNHAVGKSLLFCAAGNIVLKYGQRDLRQIKGILALTPTTGLLLMLGALTLSGVPPLSAFVSEFMTVNAGFAAHHYLLVIIAVMAMTIVLGGFVRMITGSILGTAPDTDNRPRSDAGLGALVPMGLLLAIIVIMGIAMPQPARQLLTAATSVVASAPTTKTTLPTPLSDGVSP